MAISTDVVIIGGGVMGCSLAYYLAKLGIKSTVLERSKLASGASGATAGVIAPLWHINRSSEALFALGMRSLDRFPTLANELIEAGVDPGFRQNGVLKIAFSPEEVDELKHNLAWQGELGIGVSWQTIDDVIGREPQVNPEVWGGVFSPNEGHIEGQRYVEALAHAASRLGVQVHEGLEVTGLELQGHNVMGVRTNTQVYHSRHTVLAAGPWSGIAQKWLPEKLPVRPVKGQRILLRKPGFLPRCAVRTFEAYTVPWADGTVLVAATREEGVFDEAPTAEGIKHLLSEAIASFPTLGDAVFMGARAGVRPATPDDAPIMGPLPGWEGLSVITGHDAVGIMLSPGSGELMANYIDTGNARPLEPFSIGRFPTSG